MNETKNTDMNYEHKNTSMVCPVCGKSFYDVHSYANHMMDHSEQEAKRKAEADRKAKSEQRKKDAEYLSQLYAEKTAAEKKLQKAIDDYRDKYGSVLVEYDGNPHSLWLSDLLRSIF